MDFRPATPDDMDALKELLREMHAENGLAPVNEEKAIATIEKVISDGMAILAERDGVLVGSVGLFPTKFWYSDTVYLADFWTYVRKDQRVTKTAMDLLRFVRVFAKETGLPIITGPVTPVDLERKTVFYRRAGFEPIGALFAEGF